MLVSCMFPALCLLLSDTTRHPQIPSGMAGLRHNQRHKNFPKKVLAQKCLAGVEHPGGPMYFATSSTVHTMKN